MGLTTLVSVVSREKNIIILAEKEVIIQIGRDDMSHQLLKLKLKMGTHYILLLLLTRRQAFQWDGKR